MQAARALAAHPLNLVREGVREAVAKDPKNALAVFSGSTVPHDQVASTTTLRGFKVTVDEPPQLGGADAAANPLEYYLAALLSCQVVTVRFQAARLGVQIDKLSIEASGDLDVRGFFGLDGGATRPGFQRVHVNLKLSGPESEDKYAELLEVVDAHCPVLDLTRNPTEVETTLTVERGVE